MDNSNKYRVDNEPEFSAPKPKKTSLLKGKSLWTIIAVLIVVIILVIVSIWHFDKKKPKSKSSSSSSSIVISKNTGSSTLTTYTSNGNDLNLSFNYPKNWTVSPPSDDNSKDHTITLTSPLLYVINSSNVRVAGKVILEVRPGSDSVNELNSNSPIEALSSTQIAYSAPAADQAEYPYISYIHFSDAPKVSGAFEEVIITGSVPFTQDEALSPDYLSGLDPIISASFYTCTTKTCSGDGQNLLSISDNTWQNSTLFEQVINIFESFKLN